MKSENKYLRKIVRESLNAWLSSLQYDSSFIVEIIPVLEDFILPTVIYDFYLSKKDDFEIYLRDMPINTLLGKYKSLYQRIRVFLRDIYKEYLYVKSFSNSENIKILGDIHPNFVTKFSDGKNIYYKKYPDYSDFIDTVSQNLLPEIKNFFPEITKMGDHWIRREFIDVVKRGEAEDVKSYYYNLGYIMPLLLLFRTVDSNYENILVKLPYPIFFDSECLFLGESGDFEYDILSTGLISSLEEDRSALTGGLKPIKSLLKPMMMGTIKEPKIQWVVPSRTSFDNIPKVGKDFVNPNNYIKEIIGGWEMGTHDVLGNISEIKEIVCNSKTTFRVILKATRVYRYLLFQSLYPQNFLERRDPKSFLVEELSSYSNIVSMKPLGLLEYELNCILDCKIPVFYSSLDSKEIFSPEGIVVGEHIKMPIDIWSNYLLSFDKDFLERQKKLLVKSL